MYSLSGLNARFSEINVLFLCRKLVVLYIEMRPTPDHGKSGLELEEWTFVLPALANALRRYAITQGSSPGAFGKSSKACLLLNWIAEFILPGSPPVENAGGSTAWKQVIESLHLFVLPGEYYRSGKPTSQTCPNSATSHPITFTKATLTGMTVNGFPRAESFAQEAVVPSAGVERPGSVAISQKLSQELALSSRSEGSESEVSANDNAFLNAHYGTYLAQLLSSDDAPDLCIFDAAPFSVQGALQDQPLESVGVTLPALSCCY